MHTEIKGVHIDVTDNMKDHIDKKLHKLDYAKEFIIDLLFTITKEKKDFRIEVNINFRWGAQAHISTDSFDVYEGIDILFSKMEHKISKEKEKIQEH
jgi:putative sigma-54 modulation protein